MHHPKTFMGRVTTLAMRMVHWTVRNPLQLNQSYKLWFRGLVLKLKWNNYYDLADHAYVYLHVNSLRPRRNRRYNADDIFKCFLNVWIPTKISLKFVPKGPINNITALVQIWLGAVQAPSHYLNQWWLVYWRIYASLGLNELKQSFGLYHSRTNISVFIFPGNVSPNVMMTTDLVYVTKPIVKKRWLINKIDLGCGPSVKN